MSSSFFLLLLLLHLHRIRLKFLCHAFSALAADILLFISNNLKALAWKSQCSIATHFDTLFIEKWNFAKTVRWFYWKIGRTGTQLSIKTLARERMNRRKRKQSGEKVSVQMQTGFMFVTKSKESLKFKMSRTKEKNVAKKNWTQWRERPSEEEKKRIVKRTIFPERCAQCNCYSHILTLECQQKPKMKSLGMDLNYFAIRYPKSQSHLYQINKLLSATVAQKAKTRWQKIHQ